MNVPKQFINIVGLVIVLAIIAAGAILVALPLYLQSVATIDQAQAVAATNDVQQTEIDALTQQQGSIDEVNASVSALHSQIPASAQLDDVLEIVATAASTSGVVISGVSTDPAEAFAPRSEDVIDAANSSVGDGAVADAAQAAVEPGGPLTGQAQVLVGITVKAADQNQAAAFMDALRAGPRLLQNVQSVATWDDSIPATPLRLTVSALAYFSIPAS